ncbi:MAG TPA: type II toxin-antitoxin system RelE/ParE family toxin [Lamprocystis sp. (in: g-proteobacteria)]|nr:type II toxin-antitoxin system RelE/ParE family toxin [Lamprocystis sp. (in: g-proteobacteria)]
MYAISFSRAALKSLRRMPTNTAHLIRLKFNELAADPTAMRNVKKLTDAAGYRLRIGDWRVVYTLEQDRLMVAVIKIEPRGEIYK